jgi:hypothetical protein
MPFQPPHLRTPLSLPIAMLAAALLVVAARSAPAQIASGETVRLFNQSTEIARGEVVRFDSAALYLCRREATDAARIPYVEFTRVELRRGRRRAGIGALGMGAVIGGAVGAGLGLASEPSSSGDIRIGRGGAAVILGAMGTAVGGVIGGLSPSSRMRTGSRSSGCRVIRAAWHQIFLTWW